MIGFEDKRVHRPTRRKKILLQEQIMAGARDEKINKICNILDKLTLDALLLIEQEIETKLNIENAMSSGETNLAKARYIMGQNKVSAIQLPTEKSTEITATVKVNHNEDETLLEKDIFELQLTNKSEAENVQDPIKWFGVLVPQNLVNAQNMFQQALQWSVKAVNIQTRLTETIEKINELKDIKLNLSKK